jgi:hypothetical protein
MMRGGIFPPCVLAVATISEITYSFDCLKLPTCRHLQTTYVSGANKFIRKKLGFIARAISNPPTRLYWLSRRSSQTLIVNTGTCTAAETPRQLKRSRMAYPRSTAG